VVASSRHSTFAVESWRQDAQDATDATTTSFETGSNRFRFTDYGGPKKEHPPAVQLNGCLSKRKKEKSWFRKQSFVTLEFLAEINYQKLCGFKTIKEGDTFTGGPPFET
jgi:hypothetical protein